jgi:hypothetical protein
LFYVGFKLKLKNKRILRPILKALNKRRRLQAIREGIEQSTFTTSPRYFHYLRRKFQWIRKWMPKLVFSCEVKHNKIDDYNDLSLNKVYDHVTKSTTGIIAWLRALFELLVLEDIINIPHESLDEKDMLAPFYRERILIICSHILVHGLRIPFPELTLEDIRSTISFEDVDNLLPSLEDIMRDIKLDDKLVKLQSISVEKETSEKKKKLLYYTKLVNERLSIMEAIEKERKELFDTYAPMVEHKYIDNAAKMSNDDFVIKYKASENQINDEINQRIQWLIDFKNREGISKDREITIKELNYLKDRKKHLKEFKYVQLQRNIKELNRKIRTETAIINSIKIESLEDKVRKLIYIQAEKSRRMMELKLEATMLMEREAELARFSACERLAQLEGLATFTPIVKPTLPTLRYRLIHQVWPGFKDRFRAKYGFNPIHKLLATKYDYEKRSRVLKKSFSSVNKKLKRIHPYARSTQLITYRVKPNRGLPERKTVRRKPPIRKALLARLKSSKYINAVIDFYKTATILIRRRRYKDLRKWFTERWARWFIIFKHRPKRKRRYRSYPRFTRYRPFLPVVQRRSKSVRAIKIRDVYLRRHKAAKSKYKRLIAIKRQTAHIIRYRTDPAVRRVRRRVWRRGRIRIIRRRRSPLVRSTRYMIWNNMYPRVLPETPRHINKYLNTIRPIITKYIRDPVKPYIGAYKPRIRVKGYLTRVRRYLKAYLYPKTYTYTTYNLITGNKLPRVIPKVRFKGRGKVQFRGRFRFKRSRRRWYRRKTYLKLIKRSPMKYKTRSKNIFKMKFYRSLISNVTKFFNMSYSLHPINIINKNLPGQLWKI